MAFRHDFGLLSIEDANKLRAQAQNWLAAWQKVEEARHPDAIDIYRVIKASGARRHIDIAKAVAGFINQEGETDVD